MIRLNETEFDPMTIFLLFTSLLLASIFGLLDFLIQTA